MAQGQPGSLPPGHARRAPRHFVRDTVVFEDYTIAEGMVIPQGPPVRAITRRPVPNCPSSSPAWPGAIRCRLAFVRTYGLLGYARWRRLSVPGA